MCKYVDSCELRNCCGRSQRRIAGIEVIGPMREKNIKDTVLYLSHGLGVASGGAEESFIAQIVASNTTLENNAKKVKECFFA